MPEWPCFPPTVDPMVTLVRNANPTTLLFSMCVCACILLGFGFSHYLYGFGRSGWFRPTFSVSVVPVLASLLVSAVIAVVAVGGAVALWVWRLKRVQARLAAASLCLKCRYPAPATGAICPECGADPTVPQPLVLSARHMVICVVCLLGGSLGGSVSAETRLWMFDSRVAFLQTQAPGQLCRWQRPWPFHGTTVVVHPSGMVDVVD